MVASDTVVGLVGAGVLLVALVGVFIYESQAVEGGSAEFKNVTAQATGEGTVTVTRGGTPGPVGNTCIPTPTPCTLATTFEFKVRGLPTTSSPVYVGYLKNGTAWESLGRGQCTPTECAFTKRNAPGDKSGLGPFVVGLERGEGVPAPTYPLAEFKVENRALSGTATIDFLGKTGEHSLVFNSLGSDSEVSTVLRTVPNKGLSYHGWILKQDGAKVNYTHLGAFAADNPNGTSYNASLTKTIAGGKGDYLGIIVTLEMDNKARPAPSGPKVLDALYNVVSSPTVAK